MARLVLAVLIVFAAASCSVMKRDSSASTGSTSKSKSSGVSIARGAEDLPASGGASAPKMESKRKVAEVDCSKPST